MSENKCPKCGKWTDFSGRCDTPSCENYWKSNFLSKVKRGRCLECGRSNVFINTEDGLCNDCGIRKIRLMIQGIIKTGGLKSAQIEWERMKPHIEQRIREFKQQADPELVEEIEKGIETIERDLYPERNKGSSGWIWILVIVGIVIVGGLIGFVWWESNKKRK